MSSKRFKKSLQNESREKVLTKFCDFIDQFKYNAHQTEEKVNLDELINIIDLNDSYRLSDDFIEYADLLELIKTSGNFELNSIIIVLFDLNSSMQQSAKDAIKFIRPISFYGNKQEDDNDSSLDEISKLISLLFDLVCYLKRCNELGVNFFLQLTNLFLTNKDKTVTEKMMMRFKNTRLDQLFESLQNLTISIINLEEVIRSNQKLKKDFFSFKQVIEFINLNEIKFELDDEKKSEIDLLLSLIFKIEIDLFDSNSFFSNFYLTILKSLSTELLNNPIIHNHFQSYIKYKLNEFEISKFIQTKQWLGICSLFVIYVHLFNKEDKRLAKIILETQKRLEIYLINLDGNQFILPDKFLIHNLPRPFIDRKIIDLLNQQREQLVYQSKLSEQVKEIEKNLMQWFIKFNYLTTKKPRVEENVIDYYHTQVKCLESGPIQMKNCLNTARMHVNLHVHLNKSISKNDLISICKLIIFSKAIQLAFLRKKSAILLIISRYCKFCSYSILKNFNQFQLKFKNDYEYKPIRKIELLSVINLASNCINGVTFTEQRRFISYFCISILVGAISEQDSSDIKLYFRRILFLNDLYKNVDELANCDFLCFNNLIIESFFSYCSENNANLSSELIYFFIAINDCFNLIGQSICYDDRRKVNLIKKYEDYLLDTFKVNFLDCICTQYENELRLQIHHDLQLEDELKNPFKRKLLNFSLLFNLGILPLFNRFLSIKNYLEHYLNEVSYTLTSIALHDWKTYETMLNLSRNREKLNFIFSQLPTQRLEQGLDLLELTRNIQSFVTNFNYNLNNQMFIQKPNEDRYLDVLQIQHVSNSIQTHGFGILNTAVNFIYKFLKNKFNILSQFLFQEQIKSKLLKEVRNLKESEQNRYKFEHARKLLRNLQKLGSVQSDRTYVDEFEQLITQIGNSLAFIRLLRYLIHNYYYFIILIILILYQKKKDPVHFIVRRIH